MMDRSSDGAQRRGEPPSDLHRVRGEAGPARDDAGPAAAGRGLVDQDQSQPAPAGARAWIGARIVSDFPAGSRRIARLNLPVTRIPRPMGESETRSIETDQAEREASGARPYGRYLEEFEVGAVYKHWPAKTVTEADDHLFCLLTMNHHPLHINDVYAAESQQGRNVVVGTLVYSLALGMSVADVSGKAIANLATEELSHPAPVFHGDTLFAESEVLEVRPSQSKDDRGVVKVHTRVYKQDGTLVAEFKRAVLVPRGQPG
jgi:acyl dehydratase